MNAPSAMPIRKVAAAGVAGAIVTVIVFLLEQYATVQLNDAVTAAIVTLITFAVGYLVPAAASDVQVA